MPTRLRKTRKLRGGRHMGWGQVGQHRASGHKEVLEDLVI